MPFATGWRAATVTDGDDDHSQLSKPVDTIHPPAKGCIYGFRLRAGIDVFHQRVFLCAVEIERLVHDAVEIGDAVIGLYGEGLWEFITGREQGAEVGGLEVHDLVTGAVIKSGPGCGIDAGDVVDKELLFVVHADGVIEVASAQQSEAAAIQVHLIEMEIIRILTRLLAACGEIEDTLFIFDAYDVFPM